MNPHSKVRAAITLTLLYGAIVLLSAIIDTAFFSFSSIDLSATPPIYYNDYSSLWRALPTVFGTLVVVLLLKQQKQYGYYLVLSLAVLATLIHSLTLSVLGPRSLDSLTAALARFDTLSLLLLLPLGTLAVLFVVSTTIVLLLLPRTTRALFM